jgi:hypothetical protein
MTRIASVFMVLAGAVFVAPAIVQATKAMNKMTEATNQLIDIIENVAPEAADLPSEKVQEPISEPKPTPKAKPTPTIVQHWSESCVWCKVDEAEVFPIWAKIGWKITKADNAETAQMVPWYEVFDGDGLYFRVKGRLTKEAFERAREAAKR